MTTKGNQISFYKVTENEESGETEFSLEDKIVEVSGEVKHVCIIKEEIIVIDAENHIFCIQSKDA